MLLFLLRALLTLLDKGRSAPLRRFQLLSRLLVFLCDQLELVFGHVESIEARRRAQLICPQFDLIVPICQGIACSIEPSAALHFQPELA